MRSTVKTNKLHKNIIVNDFNNLYFIKFQIRPKTHTKTKRFYVQTYISIISCKTFNTQNIFLNIDKKNNLITSLNLNIQVFKPKN